MARELGALGLSHAYEVRVNGKRIASWPSARNARRQAKARAQHERLVELVVVYQDGHETVIGRWLHGTETA